MQGNWALPPAGAERAAYDRHGRSGQTTRARLAPAVRRLRGRSGGRRLLAGGGGRRRHHAPRRDRAGGLPQAARAREARNGRPSPVVGPRPDPFDARHGVRPRLARPLRGLAGILPLRSGRRRPRGLPPARPHPPLRHSHSLDAHASPLPAVGRASDRLRGRRPRAHRRGRPGGPPRPGAGPLLAGEGTRPVGELQPHDQDLEDRRPLCEGVDRPGPLGRYDAPRHGPCPRGRSPPPGLVPILRPPGVLHRHEHRARLAGSGGRCLAGRRRDLAFVPPRPLRRRQSRLRHPLARRPEANLRGRRHRIASGDTLGASDSAGRRPPRHGRIRRAPGRREGAGTPRAIPQRSDKMHEGGMGRRGIRQGVGRGRLGLGPLASRLSHADVGAAPGGGRAAVPLR